jgi:hypothetical protein
MNRAKDLHFTQVTESMVSKWRLLRENSLPVLITFVQLYMLLRCQMHTPTFTK